MALVTEHLREEGNPGAKQAAAAEDTTSGCSPPPHELIETVRKSVGKSQGHCFERDQFHLSNIAAGGDGGSKPGR